MAGRICDVRSSKITTTPPNTLPPPVTTDTFTLSADGDVTKISPIKFRYTTPLAFSTLSSSTMRGSPATLILCLIVFRLSSNDLPLTGGFKIAASVVSYATLVCINCPIIPPIGIPEPPPAPPTPPRLIGEVNHF